MKAWLDPVRRELDRLLHPVDFFFRDDDAGWADQRLFDLLDLFADFGLSVDVAAIPMALTAAAARELSRRIATAPDRVRVHQHGFQHANHEAAGRKCEFGPARDRASQRSDIERGRNRLVGLLGSVLDPIFTPPWNRCTEITGHCLLELGFIAISRDSGAAPLQLPGLLELPIHQDWFARRKGVRLGLTEWGESLAGIIKHQAHVGIMFHHALMDAVERHAAAELLAIAAHSSKVRCRTMRSLL